MEIIQGVNNGVWALGAIATVLTLLGIGVGLGIFAERYWIRTENHIPPQVEELRLQLAKCEEVSSATEKVFESLGGADDKLWRLHDPEVPPGLGAWLSRNKPPVLLVANLKGGVGKTTLAANLAGFFATKIGRRVLLIDLDYQGSLSDMMLRAAGMEAVTSLVDRIVAGEAGQGFVEAAAIQLAPLDQKIRLLTAQYSLSRVENQLLLTWAFHRADSDARYNLARSLMATDFAAGDHVVIIDAPPRLSFGMIEALACATHLLVPSTLDGLSIEAVGNFLTVASRLREELNPGLQLAGAIGTMAPNSQLGAVQLDQMAALREQVANWNGAHYVFASHLPRKASITRAAGSQVAYFADGEVRQIMDGIGAELCERIGL